MEVHKSYKEHEKDYDDFKDKLGLWKTKQQHFNVKNPNFLTYIEKEQIKLLHARDPEEWNPEKLSESFPATAEIISKICKAKWIAESEERIKKHDETVFKNWKLLKSGNLPIFDSKLKDHIANFAKRSLKDLKNLPTKGVRKRIELPSPAINEFSSIITSCEKYKEEEPKMVEEKKTIPKNDIPATEDETYLLGKVVYKKNLRFQDLKSAMTQVKSLPISEESTAVIGPPNPSGTGIVPENPFSVGKFEENVIMISKADADKFHISPIKERVHIPRKLYKQGLTYRVEDCYYDSDGEFLYRVPGMTGYVSN